MSLKYEMFNVFKAGESLGSTKFKNGRMYQG